MSRAQISLVRVTYSGSLEGCGRQTQSCNKQQGSVIPKPPRGKSSRANSHIDPTLKIIPAFVLTEGHLSLIDDRLLPGARIRAVNTREKEPNPTEERDSDGLDVFGGRR